MNILTCAKLPLPFLVWCKSFLLGRTQCVKIKGVRGQARKITSGVPQGSKLSPFLFSAHMGSLTSAHPESKIFKYADDVVVMVPIRCDSDIQKTINNETRNMRQLWCENNGLELNESKTKAMFVKKKRSPTVSNLVSEMKILGITFQNNLKWNSHVDTIVKIAARRIYILRKMKKIPDITKDDLVQVYNSYIRSILEYNCEVFVGMTAYNARKLRLIQTRCHRIICSGNCKCSTLPDLASRRKTTCLKTLCKMMKSNNIIHHLMPPILPRSKKISEPFCVTQRRSSSFLPFAVNLYNTNL